MNKELRDLEKRLEIIYENKWQQKPYTVVSILAKYNGAVIAGVGATVWTDKDTWSDEQGFYIAKGRAMANIARTAQNSGFMTRANTDDFSKGALFIPLPG